MTVKVNFEVVVTDDDREWARDVMVTAWNNCKLTGTIGQVGRKCDCDLGAIDGCKARVEEIAKAIATARRL